MPTYIKKVLIPVLIALLTFSMFGFTQEQTQTKSKSFNIGIEAGYFMAKDEDLKDLYGSGNMIFGANMSYFVKPEFELLSGINFYSDEGKTTLTEEDIELNLTHLRIGGYYHFNPEGLDPIVGAGLDICWVKETNPIADFDDSSIGWFAGTGVQTMLIPDIKASVDFLYSSADSEGDLGDIALGGFSFLFSVKWMVF